MSNKVEFERALLNLVVKSLRPDFAAVVCGPEDSLVYSMESEQPNRKPDPGIVERVLELKEPASGSTERGGRLAVPYLDESGNVQGVMYIEVDAPRRLKKIDLAILERLRERVEARLKASQRKGSSRESEAGAQKVTEATLDIILRVIKPHRAVVVAMVEGKLKALDARVPGGEKFSAKKSLDFRLLKSLMERGEPTHLTDALAPETLELLGLSEVRGESRSVSCSPLRNSRNEVRGLVFLDSTSEVGLFDGSELPILERLAHSLERELAWVLNEDGEFLHEPAEDPGAEYRAKFGGDTIDAAELYPVSQLLALSESPEEESDDPETPVEPEPLCIELEREEQADWSDFESDWPDFEVLSEWPNEQAEEREPDSLEVVTLEREMETTEDIIPAALPEKVPSEENEAPPDLSENDSCLEEEEQEALAGVELVEGKVLQAELGEEEPSGEVEIPVAPPSGEEEEQPVLPLEDLVKEEEAAGREPPILPPDSSSEEDDGQDVRGEEESLEEGRVEDDESGVPSLEDLFTLTDEPSFSLEQPPSEPASDSSLEGPRSLSIDSAEVLFQSAEVSADLADTTAKTEEAGTSDPEVLSGLMSSAKTRAPKKSLPEDDILRSLLKEEPLEDVGGEESVEEPATNKIDSLDEEFESATEAYESEPSVGRTKPELGGGKNRKPSFVKRAWRFFWPWGKKDGGYLTPVTIWGEIFLDGKVANDAPVEVILVFPDQNMRVNLQLVEEQTEYFFSGNFVGEGPPRVSLRVQKKGYFPTKISRIKFHQLEEGFQAELNPIELLSREF